jgi:hypothetical protein
MAPMKIRLDDGDIRLRLNEYEVATILEGRRIVTTIADGFAVSLVPAGDSASSVEKVESGHVVNVPAAEVLSPSMASPAMYESPPGQAPHVLVEMDRQR